MEYVRDSIEFEVFLFEDKHIGGYTIWCGNILSEGETIDEAKRNLVSAMKSIIGHDLIPCPNGEPLQYKKCRDLT